MKFFNWIFSKVEALDPQLQSIFYSAFYMFGGKKE